MRIGTQAQEQSLRGCSIVQDIIKRNDNIEEQEHELKQELEYRQALYEIGLRVL